MFKTKTGFNCSSQACFKTAFVCGQTPSTTSTTIRQPSDRRTAVETSEEKSIWPGESIRFIIYSIWFLIS